VQKISSRNHGIVLIHNDYVKLKLFDSLLICLDWLAMCFELIRLPVLSWIRIKNGRDAALFDFNFQNEFVNPNRLMLSLSNSYE
jgi:hypothetical protein